MSKKQSKKTEVKTNVNEDPIVIVRVVNNFNDATDNNRFVSAGPNTFYRTNKSRADMLVAAGYAEYEEEAEVTVVESSGSDDEASKSIDVTEDSNANKDSNVDSETTEGNEDPNANEDPNE